MTAERRPRLRLPAEVALGAITLAALVGLHPLFDTWSYLPRLVIAAIVAHVTVAAARTFGLGLLTSALVSAGVLVVTTVWLFEASTTWYGAPTWASWHGAAADLADGWQRFQEVVAPARPSTGFLLATTLAVWMLAFVADWAAFRLWAPFEAIVPSAGLVVFAAVLGAEGHAAVGAVVYLAAALVFLLVHRAYRQEATVRWVATGTGRGTRALLVTGGVLGAVALVAGVLVAPRLPGADAPGLIALDGRGGGNNPRVTLSPLVDIRARLIDQRRTIVFTVRSEVPSYWRMTSLDRFDGQIWSSGGTFEEAQGALPNGVTPARASEQVGQEFTIEALSAIWLPAAYEPTAVDSGDLDVRWEPASSTLIVDQERATSDGTQYRVVSSIPRLTPTELRQAPAAPPELLAHYTALPEDFSSVARTQAQQVVEGAATDYDRALALQGFFREGFEYSTGVPAGHGDSAVDAFLARRVGFCEQFAGAFAAMARSVGIPARVAVGFTPGQRDPADLGRFIVRGEHAHAWPEVYLSGFGWVAFEPTPGRGAPGAESYTGVREDQATSSGDEITLHSSANTATTQAPTPVTRPQPRSEAAPAPTTTGGGHSPWPGRFAAAMGLVLGIAVLYLLAALAALGLRRARWRWQARRGPDERTRVAWLEANDALAVAGLVPDPTETPLEFSARVAVRLDAGRDEHRALALATTAADYAEGGVSTATADQAERDARTVVTGVRRRTRWHRRLARRLGWRQVPAHPTFPSRSSASR